MLALFNISSGRLWWYVILWSRSCINFTSSPAQIFSCDKVQLALKHLEGMTFFLVVLLLFMPSPSWELETNCKAVFDIFSMVRWGGSPENLNVLCSIENSLGTIHFLRWHENFTLENDFRTFWCICWSEEFLRVQVCDQESFDILGFS